MPTINVLATLTRSLMNIYFNFIHFMSKIGHRNGKKLALFGNFPCIYKEICSCNPLLTN